MSFPVPNTFALPPTKEDLRPLLAFLDERTRKLVTELVAIGDDLIKEQLPLVYPNQTIGSEVPLLLVANAAADAVFHVFKSRFSGDVRSLEIDLLSIFHERIRQTSFGEQQRLLAEAAQAQRGGYGS